MSKPSTAPVWLAFHQKDESDDVDQLTYLVVSSPSRPIGTALPLQGLGSDFIGKLIGSINVCCVREDRR